MLVKLKECVADLGRAIDKEEVKMVSSASDPSKAARQVIRAWRRKYPMSMVDDCAVVCLFLNPRVASPDEKAPEAVSSFSKVVTCERPWR